MNFHLQLNEHRRREEIIQEIFFLIDARNRLDNQLEGSSYYKDKFKLRDLFSPH